MDFSHNIHILVLEHLILRLPLGLLYLLYICYYCNNIHYIIVPPPESFSTSIYLLNLFPVRPYFMHM